jgi:hypothetical protein
MEMLEIEFEAYMEELFAGIINEDEVDETLSGYGFCGCDTCATRETFAFLLPRLLDLYEQGYIRPYEGSDE